MSHLVPVVLMAPLAAAALTVVLRNDRHRRVASFATLAFGLAMAIGALVATFDGDVIAAHMGGWPGRFAISLAIDAFSAVMLTIALVMIIVCSAFAVARGEDRHPHFHTLVLILTVGVSGAFLTADMFNLFVFFEVMLIASYVLLTLGGTEPQTRTGAVYITTNLLASTILLIGVALTYGAVGTVNMAELGAMDEARDLLVVPGALLLVAFAVKSALVPVHGWLPTAYPSAPPAVAALFAGLLTKVGIYALYRIYSVVFEGDPRGRGVLLAIACASMIVGVLGAIGQTGMRRILSFHIVSQVGYMVMGLGLFGPIGLAAGIFYVVHHIIVKTSLFLSAGAVETFAGSADVDHPRGVALRHPVLTAAFLVSALSLAGVPPLSGFFAKLGLVRAAFDSGDHVVAAIAIVVGFLTLTSMLKIYNGVFSPEGDEGAPAEPRGRVGLVAPAASLAVLSIAMGLGAHGALVIARAAAASLVDTGPYIRAVLGT